jgi:AcrR family transcriptional regulator
MRKIAEVLRLRAAGLSVRDIARSTGAGHTSVYEYEFPERRRRRRPGSW